MVYTSVESSTGEPSRSSCAATFVPQEQQCTSDCCRSMTEITASNSCRIALETISECVKFQILWSCTYKFDPPKMKLLPAPMCRISILNTPQYSITNILYPSRGTASTWNDGFVRTPADLCATTTVTVDKNVSLQTRTLVFTVSRAYRHR